MDKYELMLEFNEIINKLKEEVYLDYSKKIIDETKAMNDLDEINDELNLTDECLIIIQRYGKFPIYFKSDTNIEYSLNKIHKAGVLSSFELAEMGNFFDSIRDSILYQEKLVDSKIECNHLTNIIDNLTYNKDLNLQVKKIVTPYGEINDDASSNLKSIRKQYKDLEKAIQSKLVEIMQKNGDKLTSSTVSIRNDRFVIPVRSDFKNQVKGIIHDQSASGETSFIEPQIIVEMSNKLNQVKEQEKREIEIILRTISREIDLYYDELLNSFMMLVKMDIVFGKAKLALTMNASKPKINNKGYIDLINCYHPLLNVKNIVKNNISLGKDYKGIIITGPNTGGKTVLLKTVGLLAIMVKYGLLIPSDNNSEMAIFDKVFSDIGDEQSISQNLSTFSSHLKNVIEIIENVNDNSLVLIDELGSGTDPVEGSSLAISIIDFLINKNCDLIATSHYSELKMHAYNNEKIINASVEFDIATLSPTYRLLIGVPGMSNALNIASHLGLRKEIIDKASNYVSEKSDNLSVMLDKIVKQSNELDKKLKLVEEEKNRLNELTKQQQEEINKTIVSRDKIIVEANHEKDKIIEKTKKELEDLVYEIQLVKNKCVKPHEISDLKHKIRSLGENDLEITENNDNYDFKVGMSVFIKGYNSYGTIIKILKNNQYEVQVGIASLKVNKEDLRVSEVKENNYKIKDKKEVSLKKNISSKLDLRGCRYEEASDLIDRFIDDAIYGGLNSVTIIHGFGTGTIRKLVQEKLKNNKDVEEYHYGGAGEGGQGATIVNFKTK